MNLFFLACSVLCLSIPFFSKNLPSEFSSIAMNVPKELPKNVFPLPEEAYHEIGEGPFSLKWVSPQMQLPDLRKEIIYYGKNGRPDTDNGCHFLALSGSTKLFSAKCGEKIPLIYESGSFGDYPSNVKKDRPIWGDVGEMQKQGYLFGQKGQPSSLWLEIKSIDDSSIEIAVYLLDENKNIVTAPAEYQKFILRAQELPKSTTLGWEVGKYRADTTLFVRQKARWLGPDVFLQLHGGEDYVSAAGKERLQFLDAPLPYVCHIAEGDLLIWKDNGWKVVEKGGDSQGFALLVIKKMDEKILTCELWDPEGRSKTLLTLIKTKDSAGFPDISHDFKFVGAKTWAQFIVEYGSERLILKPHDWLILTQEGWKKIDSPEAVDDYVEGRLIGPLLVFEKCTKQNGHQSLVGHLFNTSRTAVEPIELAAAATSSSSLANFYPTPRIPSIQFENKGVEE